MIAPKFPPKMKGKKTLLYVHSNNQTNTIDQDKRVLIYFCIVVACKFQMSTFRVRKIIFELSLIWILFCLEFEEEEEKEKRADDDDDDDDDKKNARNEKKT